MASSLGTTFSFPDPPSIRIPFFLSQDISFDAIMQCLPASSAVVVKILFITVVFSR